MRARSKLRAALILVVCGTAAFGCASIFGLDELHEAPATTEAGATDASPPVADASDASPETGVGCTDPGYPARPTADSPDGGDFSILVALNRIDFGLPTSGGLDAGDGGDAGMGPPAVTGFNLDHVCTVSTGTESCVSGALGTDFSSYVVDKTDSGVDNAGGSLIQYISQMGPAFTPDAINGRLQAGQYGAVIGITGYNGQADDTQVALSFFPSFGVADGGVAFTYTDRWRVDLSDLGTAETSQYNDTTAYVKGGKVVAHLAKAPLKITVDDVNPLLTLSFDDAVLMADIVVDTDGRLRLTNGVVGGRVKTNEFLGSTDQLFYAPNGANDFICNNGIFRNYILNTVCNARDIRSNSLEDNMHLPCNAFSAGAGFDTYAVQKWTSGTAPSLLDASSCPPVVDCK